MTNPGLLKIFKCKNKTKTDLVNFTVRAGPDNVDELKDAFRRLFACVWGEVEKNSEMR